ncbi:MAG: integron cassette protein, partial [Pseudomonadota bacterium]
SPGHYYWPEIDVDLTKEIIEHPERFPLSAKIT